MTDNLSQTAGLSGHVILAGFGRTGQAIAGILRETKVPYVGVEEDFQILQSVGSADNVIYGESSSAESLMAAGVRRARVLVISFIDPIDSKQAVERARALNTKIIIIVKTDTAHLANQLINAGADHAFVDAHELGFSVVRKLCEDVFSTEREAISYHIRRARRRQNPFFSGGGFNAETDEAREPEVFYGCRVRSAVDNLQSVLGGCRVISWLRNGETLDTTQTQRAVKAGDELVLAGTPSVLEALKSSLEKEPPTDKS